MNVSDIVRTKGEAALWPWSECSGETGLCHLGIPQASAKQGREGHKDEWLDDY